MALEVRAEQALDPDNRITLLRERDALGMPRVKLHWRPTRDDHANLVTNLVSSPAAWGGGARRSSWISTVTSSPLQSPPRPPRALLECTETHAVA